jgi:hypothetical protein
MGVNKRGCERQWWWGEREQRATTRRGQHRQSPHLLRKNNLNVAGARLVGIDTTVCTVCPAATVDGLVHLLMHRQACSVSRFRAEAVMHPRTLTLHPRSSLPTSCAHPKKRNGFMAC